MTATYKKDTLRKLDDIEKETYAQKEKLQEVMAKKQVEYAELKSTVFKNDELQSRYEKWQKYILELKDELKKLQTKKVELDNISLERDELFNRCISLYCDNVKSKQHIFKYYNDLKDSLSQQIGNVEKNRITFNPAIKINKQELFEEIERIVSLKSINEEILKTNIEKIIKNKLKN